MSARGTGGWGGTARLGGVVEPSEADAGTPVRSRVVDAAWVVGALALAVVPQVRAVLSAAHQHWLPVSDNARIAAEAVDLTHGHPPLLGAESTTLENVTGIRPVHHLGPAATWVLGAFEWLVGGTAGLLLAVLVTSVLASLVALLAARALWGRAGLAATGALLAIIGASLGTSVLGDIWNPHVPIIPLVAAILAGWAFAVADWRPGLPLAAVAATFCLQSHLTHGPLLLAALLPVVAMRLVGPRFGFDRPDHRADRRWWVGTAIGTVVLWLPPLWFELTRSPSNVSHLLRATAEGDGRPALGSVYGLNLLGRVVSTPPPWGPRPMLRSLWILTPSLKVGTLCWTVLLLVAVGALTSLGWRRRDRALVGTGLGAFGLLAASWFLLQRSTFYSGAAAYQTRWLWSVFVIVWALVLAGGYRALAPAWRGRTTPAARSLVLAALTVLLVGGALFRIVSPGGPVGRLAPDTAVRIRDAHDLAAGIERAAGGNHRIELVLAGSGFSPPVRTALDATAVLLLDGYDVRLSGPDPASTGFFGGRHAASTGDGAGRVRFLVVAHDDPRVTGARPAAEVRPLSPAERSERRRLLRKLRRLLSARDVDWTVAGANLNFGTVLAAGFFLEDQRLEVARYQGELHGRRLPSLADAARLGELNRRADPQRTVALRLPDR